MDFDPTSPNNRLSIYQQMVRRGGFCDDTAAEVRGIVEAISIAPTIDQGNLRVRGLEMILRRLDISTPLRKGHGSFLVSSLLCYGEPRQPSFRRLNLGNSPKVLLNGRSTGIQEQTKVI